ncbi:MAG: L,D-transpeptidase [Ilumatobacteraceae bacterium]|nr:L,D-transpeptidase [Ilumatobacteraceae bacterium]
MRGRRSALVVVSALLLGACTQTVPSGQEGATQVRTGAAEGAAGTEPTANVDDAVSATTATTESEDSTTTAAPTTSTTEPLDVFDPECVVRVSPGDSLGAIASSRDDDLATTASLRAENGRPDNTIHPGELLDVCIDNGLDDISGAQRLERNAAIVAAENFASVGGQQHKLNALLTPLGFPEMPVDGISGPVTRRGLCAARVALGLQVNRGDMEAGSTDEETLFATAEMPVPPFSARDGRWIVIDRTCQVMFAGEGDRLVFVFPTSTGEAGHETRVQEQTRAFRYDPALQNSGWHNSTTFPVDADNPLNGNMYRPLYFDRGQAIHGANNVPTSPQSKGCARLRPSHQDALIGWLGLDGVGGPTNSASRIGVRVSVRGAYEFG